MKFRYAFAMKNHGALRLSIATVSLALCCLSVVTIGQHFFAQRRLAASKPLTTGYHSGPNNFKMDSLVGDVVFSSDAAIREQSIMLLIKQSNPVHISQLELLSKVTDGVVKTLAIQALKRLSES